ncbi:alpha-2,8-polysialyltransferase family protein [Rhodohalobacter sulfatireducens]|uniref:Alpha-2,8-polysialyltransferase family protein n=1 Tax=Rhodohalobacter sulfatireducens TaxID=2911366 RepID=A0ABS9KIY7_9BACT|nr:alpha-2,8-polysialyltransferase family protein [Rhodohalobacter sulfatireducens]MCG2590822.1 alpha-2,8-polysialyltransferase family protein [Rhodohalobacter sulfatireducens]
MDQEKKVKKFETAFIVKDAKTYTNAEEAWFQFSGNKEGSILFIIIPKEDPNNTLDIFNETIDPDKWEKIIWYKSHSNYAPKWLKRKMKKSLLFKLIMNGREYIYNFLDRIGLDRLGKKYGPIDVVFSGHRNTQEHLAFALKPKELYIMDSGMRIQKRIQPTGYINDRKRSKRKPISYILHKLVAFKIFDRKKTKIFTVYNDLIETKHQIVENDYSYRKMLVKKKITGDDVFFVSSPIFNRENISIQNYIVFIKEIFEELNLDPSNVIYIPHPVYEKKKEVQLIVDSLECRVDNRDIPIETKIALNDKLPKLCVSPYSSSIANIASFSEGKFPLAYAWHPEIDCFKEMVVWKENFIFKNPNIKLIELKNVTSIFGFKKDDCNKPKYKNFKDWDAAMIKNEA